jgi:hypothetical protein
MVAVTGGTAVFDWFASSNGGFDAFHLVRAQGHRIDDPRPLFITGQGKAEARLGKLNLKCNEERWLHEADRIHLQVFRHVLKDIEFAKP